eukprot:GGOE01064954.1.p1 GENE.GGOE01064954.1~~GGOE01064954.1.p1  ORF type:complete len:181 (+),score=17.22 GGOE01064954.1:39-581(+)
MGNTSSRKAPPLPWAPLCLGSRHCVSRCKGRRSRPPTVPEEEVGGEEVEGCGSLPVHVAVAAGITLGMCAQAAALPPLASSVLKGAAASIPLCAVVSAAVPVVRQKVEEAEEEEQRPLPDGATPSVTVWYQPHTCSHVEDLHPNVDGICVHLVAAVITISSSKWQFAGMGGGSLYTQIQP